MLALRALVFRAKKLKRDSRTWTTQRKKAFRSSGLSNALVAPYYFNSDMVERVDSYQALGRYNQTETWQFQQNAVISRKELLLALHSPSVLFYFNHEVEEMVQQVARQDITPYPPCTFSPDAFRKKEFYQTFVTDFTNPNQRVSTEIKTVSQEIPKIDWTKLSNRLHAVFNRIWWKYRTSMALN